jgi:hypothetical protein
MLCVLKLLPNLRGQTLPFPQDAQVFHLSRRSHKRRRRGRIDRPREYLPFFPRKSLAPGIIPERIHRHRYCIGLHCLSIVEQHNHSAMNAFVPLSRTDESGLLSRTSSLSTLEKPSSLRSVPVPAYQTNLPGTKKLISAQFSLMNLALLARANRQCYAQIQHLAHFSMTYIIYVGNCFICPRTMCCMLSAQHNRFRPGHQCFVPYSLTLALHPRKP